MDNVAYVGLSRQMTLRRELDVIANNIANADTAGFKLEQLTVESEPRRLPATDGGGSTVAFALDSGVARDFSQGALKPTGAPFDFAIEGSGFFAVAAPGGERYTRDGRFALDEQGRLVNASGHPVQGSGGGELRLDPARGPASVAADGTVSQAGVPVGKLGVVRFAAAGALAKDGDGLYRNVSNLQPELAPEARVRQGAIEASNVQPVREITRLIEVSRAYENIARIVSQAGDLSSRSIERLGRVG